MAFLPGDEEEEGQQAFDEKEVLAPAPGAGAGAGGTGPGGGVALAEPQQQQSAGEGFTDTASYLAANRPQAVKLSERVGEQLTESGGKIRTDIEQAGQQFGERAAAGTVRYDEGLVQRAIDDPVSFIQDPGDLAAFEKQRDAAYTSPGKFEEQEFFPDVQQRIEQGQRLGQLGETERGRRELLFSLGTNPTAGQVELDQLLIGGTPEARSNIQAASQQFYGEIPDYLKATSETGAGQLAAGQQETAATKQALYDIMRGEQGAIPTLERDIEQRVGTSRESALQRTGEARSGLDMLDQMSQQQIKDMTEGGILTDQQLGDIGMTREQAIKTAQDLENLRNSGLYNVGGVMPGMLSRGGAGQVRGYAGDHLTGPEIYGGTLDATQFMTELSPDYEIWKGNVSTPDEFARYQALSQLAAIDPAYLTPDMGQYAGTAPEELADVRYEDLMGRSSAALREADLNAIDQQVAWIDSPYDEAGIQNWVQNNPEYIAQSYYGAPYGNRGYGSDAYRALGQSASRALQRQGYWGGPTPEQTAQYWTNPGQPGTRYGI